MALKLRATFVAVCALMSQALAAQTVAPQGFLFISSAPYGAAVLIDGALQTKKTPLLARGLKEGEHRVEFVKEGYLTREVKVELPSELSLDMALSPLEPVLHIDGEGAVRVAGRKAEEADGGIVIRAGAFAVRPAADGIDVVPVFGGQKVLDGVAFALPLFLGLSGVLTVREILWPRESPFPIAPELAASSLISGGLAAWDIALEVEKKKFLESYELKGKSADSLAVVAKIKFENASETMIRGDFESALAQFGAIAAEYPESPLASRALFEGARLQYITGDKAGAAAAYHRIVDDYPELELYDRALKGLADCLAAQGDLGGATAALDLMTFRGPGYSRDEIESYRRGLGPTDSLSK